MWLNFTGIYHYDNFTDCEAVCAVKCETTQVIRNDVEERQQYSCRQRKPPLVSRLAHLSTSGTMTFLIIAAGVSVFFSPQFLRAFFWWGEGVEERRGVDSWLSPPKSGFSFLLFLLKFCKDILQRNELLRTVGKLYIEKHGLSVTLYGWRQHKMSLFSLVDSDSRNKMPKIPNC